MCEYCFNCRLWATFHIFRRRATNMAISNVCESLGRAHATCCMPRRQPLTRVCVAVGKLPLIHGLHCPFFGHIIGIELSNFFSFVVSNRKHGTCLKLTKLFNTLSCLLKYETQNRNICINRNIYRCCFLLYFLYLYFN